MIIKGNKIATPADNLELPFSLDVAKNPKQIKRNIRYALGDNKFKLVEYYSIYRFDGGRWMLCLFDYGPAQTGVPKAFPEPGKASEQEVIVEVFERLREEKKPFRGRQVVRRFIVPSQRW